MIERLKKNVCRIEVDNGRGTGFLISDRFIMTAYHVIEEDKECIEVYFNEETKPRKVILYKKYEDLDIAILKLELNVNFFQEIDILDMFLSNGMAWMTIGYPNKEDNICEIMSHRDNIIQSSLEEMKEEKYDLALDLNRKFNSYKGLSGSPLIVKDKIVGIINNELRDGERTIELKGLSVKYFKKLLIDLDVVKEKYQRPEIKFESKNILTLAIAQKNIKKLSENKGIINNLEKINYEYYTYLDRKILKGFLFLGNNIINQNLFPFFKKQVNKQTPDEIDIFIVKKILKNNEGKNYISDRKKDIEKYIEQYRWKKRVAGNIYYIDDFIWENTSLGDLNENNLLRKRNDFIDQIIYKEDESSINKLSIDFFEKEIINHDIPISIVYGSGGVGKTTFCDTLKFSINNNKKIKKKVFYIKGEKIVEILLDKNYTSYTIKSLTDLYELYKDENDFIDLKVEEFNLNYITGNMIVIIDAIEEIESALGDRFVLNSFIDSLKKLNEKFFSTHIIITTRELFYEKIKISIQDNDIQYFKLLGFSTDDLDAFLKKRYQSKSKISEVKKFIETNTLFDTSKNRHIIPLFVDWVCKIIDRPENEDRVKSDYFLENMPIDKLLIRLINREIVKQSLSADIDSIFKLLEEIIISHNSSISKSDFKEYIEIEIGDSKIDNYIKNPLFLVENNYIKIKYDILDFFIKSRSLRYKLLKKQDAINLLKDCYDGKSELFSLLLPIIGNDIMDNLRYQIKYLTNLIKNEKYSNALEKENIKKSISAILYIAIETLVEKEERFEYTSLLCNLYNINNEIYQLFIYGVFYPLNFKEIIIRESEFNRYDNFINCSFPVKDEPIFYYTKFHKIKIPNSNEIHSKLFDTTCQYQDSNIEEIIKETDKKNENKKNKIYKDIGYICRKIGDSRKSFPAIKSGRTFFYHKGENLFISSLVDIGLLEENTWKGEKMYIISSKYYDDLPDIKLGNFSEELEDKIDDIFDLKKY